MATSRGEIENIAAPAANVTIFGLGWILPSGQIEDVNAQNVTTQSLRQSEDELESLITAGDIEIRNAQGTVVLSGGVGAWIDAVVIDETTPTVHVLTVAMDQRVPSSGERWFQWNTAITQLEVRWPVNAGFTILRTNLGVEQIDTTNTYGLRLYHGSDINNHIWESGIILNINTRAAGVNWPLNPTPVEFVAGTYLWSAYRVSGSGTSDFTKCLANIFYLRED